MSRKHYRGYRGKRGNITAAIWLIGLGILALTNQWWPGILILVGLSMVANAIMPANEGSPKIPRPPRPPRPQADETDHSYLEEPFPEEDDPAPPVPEPPMQVRVSDTPLPPHCPMCGAPVEASKVTRDPSGAPICTYCEASLNA